VRQGSVLSIRIVLFLSLMSAGALSQERQEFFETIEDNSYFLEEAYNQEEGVVQHVFSLLHFGSPQRTWEYGFSQEWPLWSGDHQFSYEIPYSTFDGHGVHGVGDIMLSYRYQLLSASDAIALAPRLSFVLPTGSHAKGLGNGRTGCEAAVALSKRISSLWAVHANAGVTITPSVSGTDAAGKDVTHTLTDWCLSGSVICCATSTFIVLVETVMNSTGEINEGGALERSLETTISPGVRYAVNAGELQIVPGLALPVTFVGGERSVGALFYLSFEHPF
jgi:hypothetical protein